MRYTAVARRPISKSVTIFAAALVLSSLLILCLGLFNFSFVSARDTSVDVRVCGLGDVALISITEPVSDSVTNQKTVTLSGEVDQVSQVDVRVNGNYDQTVAIGFLQSTFSTNVTLSEGTVTIDVVASDACGGADALDSVVITYHPEVDESEGEETPTEVVDDRPPGGGGVTVSDRPPLDNESMDSGSGVQMPPIVDDFLRITDLSSIAATGNRVNEILRLIAVLAGIILIVGASGVVGRLGRWRDGEVKTWELLLVQLVGLGMIVLALVL